MLRITRLGANDAVATLKLEGKLLEPWVDEVVRACEAATGSLRSTRLDLSAVTFVDAAGAELLRELLRQGVAISACSGYVAELLHRENS